ncbi:MAG: TonB-dependent receptor domain-containing protein [Terriglobia bacterium]
MLALRYSVLRLKFDRAPGTQGFDLTKLGFPASLRDQIGLPLRHVPNQFVTGMASLFGGGVVLHREDFHSAGGSLTRIAGRHTLRFGTELRWVRYNFGASNEPSGRYTYDGSFTTVNPLAPAGTGAPFADFLFGYANSGTVLTPGLTAQQRFYRAFFVQDDFRVRRNLTLNLGLRYDQDGDWTERFDRQVIFVPGAAHPLAQPTGLPLRGNLAVVNSPDRPARTPVDTRLNQWGPRAGLAYQVTANTVIRAGYGISWIPGTLDLPERSTFGLGQLPTQYVASTDGGRTPASRLSNPFPGGLLLPPGRDAVSALLYGTDLQVGAAGFNPNGYSQQWNFNIQRQLPRQRPDRSRLRRPEGNQSADPLSAAQPASHRAAVAGPGVAGAGAKPVRGPHHFGGLGCRDDSPVSVAAAVSALCRRIRPGSDLRQLAVPLSATQARQALPRRRRVAGGLHGGQSHQRRR